MSSVKEKQMKRKLFASEQEEKSDSNPASTEKKKRRKNAVETQRHYPKSERQQLALVLQMSSVENSSEPTSSPPPSLRKTSGSSGRKDKIHKRNVRGETLLHLCTIRGDIEGMKKLIRQGADVNVQDFAGWTPLHEACNHGHQEITQYLLQVGANVNSKGLEDDTPLHDAVTNSHRDLVELLLKHGANPLLKNKKGERPLDIAEDKVIRELMQKEIILSDEDSDLDRDCTSPSRSEDSIGSRKALPKKRTTSTSSCGQQESLEKNRKKTHKLKTSPEKPRVFSQLSSDSSSDSDSSDDKPLVQKKNSYGISHSNGYGNTLRKTPTVSAGPLKTSKTEQKRKSIDNSSKTSRKVRISARKSLSSSSSDTSSDSDHQTQTKGKNGTFCPLTSGSKSSAVISTDKKDHTKQKSLYNSEKSQLNDRNTTQRTDPPFKRKSSLNPGQVQRVRSLSSEGEKSKSKLKTNRIEEEKTNSKFEKVQPLVNGVGYRETSELTKDHADESVYDFSLSTEDFTDTSAISLKQKYDKSSELFDILCLGKTKSSEIEPDTGLNFDSLTASKPRKPSKDKLFPVRTIEKDTHQMLVLKGDGNLDKNHNKALDGVNDVTKNSDSMLSVVPNADKESENNAPSKVEMHMKDGKAIDKQSVAKTASCSLTAADTGSLKQELKSEKKLKKRHSISDSPKKPLQSNGPTAYIKSDTPGKKTCGKLESPVDAKPEKQKKISFEGEAKPVDGETSSSGLVKKKKKHKHKHSHDTPSSEHKHRQRVGSSEQSASEKFVSSEKSALAQNKPSLKKVDSSKSLHGSMSRKNSQEAKPDGSVIPAAKKKARSTDSTSSDTSVKSSKLSGSLSKQLKSSLSGSSQEKTTPTASVKRDKPEAKKFALVSDANSFFLSDLDKSSKQKQEEKKRKEQRKKKLLLQQRLKAQNAAESASKDTKTSTPTAEKSALLFSDKASPDSSEFHDVNRRTPAHASLYSHQQGQQGEQNLLYRQNYVDPFYEHSNTLNHHDLSQGVFKSPPLAGRSISQVDARATYPHSQEVWSRGERTPHDLPQGKKHPPVQRSLSFSAHQPDGMGPLKNSRDLPPHHDSKSSIQQQHYDGIHQRPLTGEVPHGRQPSYPSSSQILNSTCTAQPHPVNGPLLPPGSHPPPHSAVTFISPASRNLVSSKPTHYAGVVSEPILGTVGISHLVTDVTSNVPISSPVIAAKVPVHPVVANPSNSSKSSPPAVVPAEVEVGAVPDTCTKQDEKPMDTDSGGSEEDLKPNGTDDKKVEQVEEDLKEDKQPSPTSDEEKPENVVNRPEMERKAALEKYIQDHLSKLEVIFEEPKPKRLPVFIPMEKLKKTAEKDPTQDRLNVYEEWMVIQKQITEKRKKYYTAVVIPQAPHCYCEYLTYTGAYLLSGNRESWLSVPVLAPPPSLTEEMQALFVEHEKERVKLHLQHATQREKLIVACEQEIMRMHSRAARMLQNQQIPLSACSVLLDREIYYLERRNKKVQEDSNGRTSIRDRFNGRMMLSWLQDVEDKYVKMKTVLLARQRHEAQALHAVQRTEWFLKQQEVENQGQQKRWTNSKPDDVSDVYVPLVNISDDFDLLPG